MSGHERRPLTYAQVAQTARRSERQVRRWIANGLLTAHDIRDGRGGSMRVVWSDELDAFLGLATLAQLDMTDDGETGPDRLGHDTAGQDQPGYVEQGPAKTGAVVTVPQQAVTERLDALAAAIAVLPAISASLEGLNARLDALVSAQGHEREPPAEVVALRTAIDTLSQQVGDMVAERRAATLAEQARQRDAQTAAATPEQPVTHPWWQVWRPGR